MAIRPLMIRFLAVTAGLAMCTKLLGSHATVSATVTADSSMSGTYAPWKILDGDVRDHRSRWVSAKTRQPHWLTIHMDKPITFSRLVIHGNDSPYALREAELQVMNAGKWQPIWSLKDGDKAVQDARFAEITTDQVRLAITKACQPNPPYGYAARLYELEFYKDKDRVPVRAAAAQSTAKATDAPAEPPVEPATLLSSVRPFPAKALSAPAADARTRALLQAYYDSVLEWNAILLDRFQPIPEHDDWGYYGDPDTSENTIRPMAYAIWVNAFLSEAQPPSNQPSPQRRARMRQDAIAVLRYLTQCHVSGAGAALNGRRWGNSWQSAMWARATGMGGWTIWEHLDEKLKLAVARMVEYEADRFLHKAPKSSEFGDTGAEENSWNAKIVALARNMMPDHPRAARWDQAAKTYMYNVLSVAADHEDETPGDDGRRIRDWVTTINAHPDFTVENHGLVHVGYLKHSVNALLINGTHYLITGMPVPRACLQHTAEAFDVLTHCMSWDGGPIYFGGNDWKLVHTQNFDIGIYAMRSLLVGDRAAAYLEEAALKSLRALQKSENGYYCVRRDLEYGGICATTLVACYMAHAVRGPGASPLSQDEFNDQASGVTYLKFAEAMLHRTPTKFASFTWGPKRMALAMPERGNWVTWPHFDSYVGRINGKGAARREAKLEEVHPVALANGFTVTARLRRFDGRVMQDFSHASLAGDVTVYVEKLTVAAGFAVSARETGIVGHEYELGSNERILHSGHGTTRVIATGNPDRTIQLPTDWLNIGNRIGYVVRRTDGRKNLMRYHDFTSGEGRVPKLQEWLSLIGDQDPATLSGSTDWACVVTFLNQNAADTAREADNVDFTVQGQLATCRIGEALVRADFGTAMRTEVLELREHQ